MKLHWITNQARPKAFAAAVPLIRYDPLTGRFWYDRTLRLLGGKTPWKHIRAEGLAFSAPRLALFLATGKIHQHVCFKDGDPTNVRLFNLMGWGGCQEASNEGAMLGSPYAKPPAPPAFMRRWRQASPEAVA
jgi:hypothetical protein